jgi:hypothetical protein
MRVLVACEYSATVRDAFRALGHEAWSCDLLPCEGDARWHLQEDVIDVIERGITGRGGCMSVETGGDGMSLDAMEQALRWRKWSDPLAVEAADAIAALRRDAERWQFFGASPLPMYECTAEHRGYRHTSPDAPWEVWEEHGGWTTGRRGIQNEGRSDRCRYSCQPKGYPRAFGLQG